MLFDKDISVTPEEIFNAGIFISTSRDPTLVNLPNISDLLKIVPERATTGDIITFLIGSIDTIITMQPGEGGSIARTRNH